MLEIQLIAEDQAKASVLMIDGLRHDLKYAAAADSDLTEELLVMFVRILSVLSGCYASMKHSRVINSLGYAGLLPFLAAVWALMPSCLFWEWPASQLFLSYSVIILSFLAGALWGKAKELEESAVSCLLLIGSNAFALTGWLAVLLGKTTCRQDWRSQ